MCTRLACRVAHGVPGAQDPDAFCAAAEDEQTALRAQLTAATERLEQARRRATCACGAHVGLHAGARCRDATPLACAPPGHDVRFEQGGGWPYGVPCSAPGEMVSRAESKCFTSLGNDTFDLK